MFRFRTIAATVCGLAVLSTSVWADPGDEVCFPLYRATGAVPGTPTCPLTASTASVGLGNTQCTANFGATSSIPRYCGTVTKDLGKCPATPYPISLGTANKTLVDTDYKHDGLLSFTRRYNSTPAAATGTTIGRSWRWAFESRVLTTSTGAAVYRPDGRIVYFTQGATSFTADTDVNDQLLRQPATGTLTGWRFHDQSRGHIEVYDASGRLTRVTRTDGRSLALTRSTSATSTSVAPGPDYVIGVVDDFGRGLSFIYNASGQAVRLTVPDGTTVAFGYDASGNLNKVTYPDGRIKTYHYNEAAFNASVSQRYALTGITDESGTRTTNYFYDAKGRAVREQLLAQSGVPVNEYNISYDSFVGFDATSGNVVTTGQSTMRDPLGSQYTYTFSAIQGATRVIGASKPGGAGCLATSNALSYDANGNVALRDDFNGSRECKAYDLTRNLETVAVDGLPGGTSCSLTAVGSALPPNSRKTSTQWHPDWQLPVKVAEPKKLTTSVYNGQPDPFSGGALASCAPNAVLPDGKPIVVLCKKVEQATTDNDGSQGFGAALRPGSAARVQRWAYNQYGQMLTATDPRGNTTTYAYYGDSAADHAPGDLRSVTNPAGQVMHYPSYDRNGRNLRSVEPNGATTDTTYTPRGWVNTVSVTGAGGGAALVTTHGYDAAGKLLWVQGPDGARRTYAYDGASRLTGTADAAGNSTIYTLDNAGNRTTEIVQSPTGQRARSVNRVIDALGRVQRVTGAER
jgi:YD repeat-containing protein